MNDAYIVAKSARSERTDWSTEAVITPEPWTQDALCAQTDPEAFFPEKGGSTRDAKKVCAQCPVVAQCLEYALRTNQRFGIWGGLSERERRKLQGSKKHRNAGKDVCINGHRFTDENTRHGTYVGRDGTRKPRRVCRTCSIESSRRKQGNAA
jgi:WhiB family redox-sensing transcriptional regulator